MAGFLEISVFGQDTLVLPLKKGGFLIVYVPKHVYVLWSWLRYNSLLRTVLTYLCCTKPFQVFIVLIAVTPIESWSKAVGMCGSCEGTVGDFER
jgi:hypothetical protein